MFDEADEGISRDMERRVGDCAAGEDYPSLALFFRTGLALKVRTFLGVMVTASAGMATSGIIYSGTDS